MTSYHAFFSDDVSYHISHSLLLLVCSVFAILAVTLRFYARRIQKSPPELNDYLIVFGLVIKRPHLTIGILTRVRFSRSRRLSFTFTVILPAVTASVLTNESPLELFSFFLTLSQSSNKTGL